MSNHIAINDIILINRSQKIEDLKFSTQAILCLINNNIYNVGELLCIDESKLKHSEDVDLEIYVEIKKMKDNIATYGNLDNSKGILADLEEDEFNNLKSLGLSVRALYCLMRHGIYTLDQLLALDESELMNIEDLKGNTLEEVKSFIETKKKLINMSFSKKI